MAKPIAAIVGRPNVGKSTLFNDLTNSRISIVESTPGVTRDRIMADCTWLDKTFTLIDTGGIEPESRDVILSQMREQAQTAIDMADVIIFVVDVRTGLQDTDTLVADMLRKSGKPIVLAVNKVDDPQKFANDIYEFYNLGLGDPYPISAASRQGLGDLLDAVCADFNPQETSDEDEDIPRVAIIGKPNVGKSSLINRLLGQNRLIVSDIPGTTRDAVDTRVEHDGSEYIFIDTAGLRRKSRVKEDLEHISVVRAVAAIERCDIAVLLIDAVEGVTEQDAKIAGLAQDRGKGIIIAVNKWDAIEKDDKTIYEYEAQVRSVLSFIPYAEMIFISALTGQRIDRLFRAIDVVSQNQNLRIPTGVLNEVLTDSTAMQQPPSDKGRQLRLYYITQAGVKPPTFVIFVNDKKLMHFSYQRYLENCLRKTFGFKGTPLKFILRERKSKE